MPNRMHDKPQTQVKHPRDYIDDLNPDKGASQNIGEYSIGADPNAKTAADVKDLVRMFHDRFTFDELRLMPLVPEGTPLKQGAIYLDLAARERGELVGHGRASVARADQFLIPKSEVPYEIWNRLLRIS